MQLTEVHKCRQQLHLVRACKLWSMVWIQNRTIIETEGKNDPVFLNNMPLLTFQHSKKRGKESEERVQLQQLGNITWAKDGLSEYLTAEKTIGGLF